MEKSSETLDMEIRIVQQDMTSRSTSTTTVSTTTHLDAMGQYTEFNNTNTKRKSIQYGKIRDRNLHDDRGRLGLDRQEL